MNPFTPSIQFLAVIFVVSILLVILSQRVKRYEKPILIFIWIMYAWIILAMAIPPVFTTTKKLTFQEMLIYSSPWNLKPFSLIKGQFRNMMDGQMGAIRQFMGNLVLFMPAGFLPPMLMKGMRRWRNALLPGFLWSLFIELSQLSLHLLNMGNRSFDTDDLILNTLGALFGFIVYKIIFHKRHSTEK